MSGVQQRAAAPPVRPRAGRGLTRAALVLLAVAAAAFAWRYRPASAPTQAGTVAPAAVPVVAGAAAARDVPIWLSGIGAVTPINAVDVKVRVDGQVQSLFFTEGQEVAAGQVLAQIDPRPYQATLAQAVAARQRDLAQFASARQEVARAGKLAAAGAGTSQSLDTVKAQQASLQASLEADQATIDAAKLNLEFTRIVAPLAGRAGMRQVDPGAIVHASDAAGLVTLTQMAPITVTFTLPQDQLPAVLDGQRQGKITVQASSRDGTQHIADGELVFINSTVDAGTGQIQMKATYPNADRRLWPGAFVSVRVLVRTDHNAIVIPSEAVQTGQNGLYVYLIQSDGTVAVKPVTTGSSVDGITEIQSGLAAGDRVVLQGQSRLAPGRRVTIDPATAAAPAAS